MPLVSPSLSAISSKTYKNILLARFRSRIGLVSILIRVNLPRAILVLTKHAGTPAQSLERDTCFGYVSLGFLLDKTMTWPVHLPFKTVHHLYARAFIHIVIPTNINNVTEFDRCRRRDRIRDSDIKISIPREE